MCECVYARESVSTATEWKFMCETSMNGSMGRYMKWTNATKQQQKISLKIAILASNNVAVRVGDINFNIHWNKW